MGALHAAANVAEKIRQAQTFQGTPPGAFPARHRNIASLLAEHARASPARPYLVTYEDGEGRREWTYAAFWERVCRIANAFAGLGVGKGDRVATLCVNEEATVAGYLAALSLGAVIVPLSPGEDDSRARFVLEHAQAKLLVHRPEFEERAAHLVQGLDHVRRRVVTGSRAAPGAPCLDDLAAAGSARTPDLNVADLGDEALIVYTSGTTCAPKGVVLCHRNLLADIEGIGRWHRIGADDRLMCVLPIHHVNGTVVTLLTPISCGASVVLNRRFRTETFWKRLCDERVQIVSVVPTLLQYLLQEPQRAAGLDRSGFRHLICGAGPLTVELASAFEDRFGCRIVHGYGLSETTCYSSFLPIDLPAAEHRRWMRDFGFPSIGPAIPPNEMAIHDGSGRPLGRGQRGEIVIRGHNVMLYYFRRPEANAETFMHGWFRSGDEGFFEPDAQGRPYYFITGRIKELIIRGGVNLSPFEVDEVLMRIPGVRCGLAVGFDSAWYGEEVGAYIVPEEGVSLDAGEILAQCRRVLPFSKSPKVVVFGSEVPATSTGKYQRNRLKHHFAAYRDAQFRDPSR